MPGQARDQVEIVRSVQSKKVMLEVKKIIPRSLTSSVTPSAPD